MFILFILLVININSIQVQKISNFFDKNLFSFNDNIFNIINFSKEAVEEVNNQLNNCKKELANLIYTLYKLAQS